MCAWFVYLKPTCLGPHSLYKLIQILTTCMHVNSDVTDARTGFRKKPGALLQKIMQAAFGTF